MRVNDWIADYLDLLRRMFGSPHDWPIPESEEYADFVKSWVTPLKLKDVTWKEADEAARRMAANPPNWRREWVPAVLREVDALRAAAGSGAATRESARLASLSCPHCSGEGLVSVFHPAPDRSPKSPRAVAAHCNCPHGRFVRHRLTATDPELARRTPDLEAVLAGRSAWRLEPPAPREAACVAAS